jgi:hypothetical protein
LCQWLRSCTHPDEDSERETTDLWAKLPIYLY